jgi:hypothetical protein
MAKKQHAKPKAKAQKPVKRFLRFLGATGTAEYEGWYVQHQQLIEDGTIELLPFIHHPGETVVEYMDSTFPPPPVPTQLPA